MAARKANKLFANISATVDTEFELAALHGHACSDATRRRWARRSPRRAITSAGLDAWQKALVSYAGPRGFLRQRKSRGDRGTAADAHHAAADPHPPPRTRSSP